MDRWQALPVRDRFRLYSRISLHLAILVLGLALFLGNGASGPVVWPAMAATVVCALAAITVLETWPELTGRPATAGTPWIRWAGIGVLSLVWLFAVVAARVGDEPAAAAWRVAAIGALCAGCLCSVQLTRHRWWITVAAGVVTGLLVAQPGQAPTTVVAGVASAVTMVGVLVLVLWSLRIVDELEHAKDVEGALQLAQERLRFSRDLHDVVGRNFSAIAVKSELAAQLSRAGAHHRAETEMLEVKQVAVGSMEEMRSLVRGYRDIDLVQEVEGARSLLAAAGVRLQIEGDPELTPARLHHVAAWVVREGTTNIVRHSRARTATLAFGRAGMSLENDGVLPSAGLSTTSGLAGLAERLAAVDAVLTAEAEGATFRLTARWGGEPDAR